MKLDDRLLPVGEAAHLEAIAAAPRALEVGRIASYVVVGQAGPASPADVGTAAGSRRRLRGTGAFPRGSRAPVAGRGLPAPPRSRRYRSCRARPGCCRRASV